MSDPGVFDPNTALGQANGTGDSTSGQRSLWDLGGLEDKPIITQNRPVLGKSNNPRGANIPEADDYHIGSPQVLVTHPIDLYSKDPKQYLQLQQQLYAGGFYGATPASSIPWGSDPTGSTYEAWKKVLIAAQQAQSIGHNVTPGQILQQAIEQHQSAVANAPTDKPALVVQYTDPAALAGIVQQAAQASLGRNLSKAEVNSFVNEFHAQEAAYSKKAYTAQQDTTGKQFNLTQPSAQADAEQFVQQGHPTEAGGELLASYVGVLQNLLNGG